MFFIVEDCQRTTYVLEPCHIETVIARLKNQFFSLTIIEPSKLEFRLQCYF